MSSPATPTHHRSLGNPPPRRIDFRVPAGAIIALVVLFGFLVIQIFANLRLESLIEENRQETLTNRQIGRDLQHSMKESHEAVIASTVARERNAVYMRDLVKRAGGDPDAVLAATRPAKP